MISDSSGNPVGHDPGPHILGRAPGLVAIIAYEAIWGFFQALSGVLLLFSSGLISAELAEDSQNRFLGWLLSLFNNGMAIKIGLLFVASGTIKLALAAGLYFHARLTRRLALVFFSGVAVFGAYRLTLVRFSFFELLILAADVAILLYFWLVLPRHVGDAGMN